MNNTQSTELIFELCRPGRCHRLPASDVSDTPLASLLPMEHLAAAPPLTPDQQAWAEAILREKGVLK